MHSHHYLIYIVLIAGSVLSVVGRKLTVTAAITGGLSGLLIFIGAGYTGVAMLALFFILGSTATNLQLSKKIQLKIAERNKGRRTTGQVLANGGVAALLGIITWFKPELSSLIQLMIAGSLAAATADTLSSELGSVYGRKFYHIITFKKSAPGPDGVVSIEGTLIGMAGAAIIALVYALGFGFNYLFWIIIIAGATGNLFDSVLGATLEQKHILGNNMVNFLNTLMGAVVCLLLALVLK